MKGKRMKSLIGKGLALATLGLVAAGALAVSEGRRPAPRAPKKATGKTDPKGVPLELRLVAKKAKYTLDLGGKTAKEFTKQLKEAVKSGIYPAPTAVDLKLELRNNGKKDLQVHVEGDGNLIVLNLRGKGAVSVRPRRVLTQEFRVPKTITIAAGKSYSFPAIKSLIYGFRGVSEQAYWTKAGTYTLTASYQTAVSPAPKGAKDAGNGFGRVLVTSAPLKVKVVAK
jgi:hypothetical protein